MTSLCQALSGCWEHAPYLPPWSLPSRESQHQARWLWCLAQNVAESGVLGKALRRGGHKSCLVLSQEETSPPPEDKSSQRCQKWKESRTRGQSLGGQGRAKNSPPVKQAPMREEPGMLQSVGLQRVGHDLVAEQQQQQRAEAEGGLGTWVTGRKQGALL